jgi:hypothetical protein
MAHKGPATLRPRCIQGGSSVAVIPIYLPIETELIEESSVLGYDAVLSLGG